MTTNQTRKIVPPIKGNLVLLYGASSLIAFLMTVASVAGLINRTAIYPNEEYLRTFVANDIVNLIIGVPILLGSIWLAKGDKLIGLLCWPGALLYVIYNYIAYVLALPVSWVFALHLVLVVLSLYTLIGLVASIDGKIVQKRLTGAVSEKWSGGVLVGFGLLFSLRVIGVIVNAITSGTLITDTDLAVNISDFFISPAMMVGGIFLWQRKELGYVTGLGLLFQASMLFIGLIIFLLIQPLITTAPFAVLDILMVFVMGLVCFIPFARFVRGVAKGARPNH